MASRSIASLSLSFGLVSIPIKLYSATESSAAIRFKLMSPSGERVKQQYVSDTSPAIVEEELAEEQEQKPIKPVPPQERSVARTQSAFSKVLEFPGPRQAAAPRPYEPAIPAPESIVERSAMLKGYEYAKGKFVLFTSEELKALQAGSRKTIDIVSFIPEKAVDPIYYDKAYLLAPDKRGSKPYNLLLRAMQDTGRCALARWAFRSKEYVVQIRVADGGLVLQQLLYAEEVRSFADLDIQPTEVGAAELSLAKQLIAHISAESYDPTAFVDEEKKRIQEAVEKKIAGKEVLVPAVAPHSSSQVIDLLSALRASLQAKQGVAGFAANLKAASGQRKPAKRAPKRSQPVGASPKARSGKR